VSSVTSYDAPASITSENDDDRLAHASVDGGKTSVCGAPIIGEYAPNAKNLCVVCEELFALAFLDALVDGTLVPPPP
jgi:hypothetical protein